MELVDLVHARLCSCDREAIRPGIGEQTGSRGDKLMQTVRGGGLLLMLAVLTLGAAGTGGTGKSGGVAGLFGSIGIARAEPVGRAGVTKPVTAGRTVHGPLGRQRRPITDQDILDQAQAAYIRGERQHAIDLATGIAEKGGALAGPAWRFIGLVACSVRAHRLATRAFGNLMVTDDQEALILACKSNGLAFINREFVEH